MIDPFLIRRLSSPAKVNLFLYVTARRPDGYHELCSLMAKIGLADEIRLALCPSGIEVVCDHPLVPSGPANLAHQAARLFFDTCRASGKTLPAVGVRIRIQKRIPVGGGLGGGSSNAGTVLSALNEACGGPLSESDLMRLGLRLGADVPFFIFGGPALARGVGEVLTRIPDLPPLHMILCDPGVVSSTPKVFKKLEFNLTSDKKQTINTVSNVLPRGQGEDIRQYVYNELEAAAFSLYPEILSTKEEMALLLNETVTMSGSGSSLFALFSEEKTARQGYDRLRRRWPDGPRKIFLTSLRNG